MFGKSVFHNSGQIEDDGLEDEHMYVNLGAHYLKFIKKELENAVSEEVLRCLSEKEDIILKEIIRNNKAVFKIRLESRRSEELILMKIVLKPAKKPSKAKVRKYSA